MGERVGRGDGSTEEVALDVVAPELGEPFELVGCFDTFGDGGHAEVVGQGDRRADDPLRVSATGGESGDEALVDLEQVPRERRESGPVLVDLRETHSVSREARRTFASSTVPSRIAMFVQAPVSRVIANFFIGVAGPNVPTRVFTDFDDAQRWLLDEQ